MCKSLISIIFTPSGDFRRDQHALDSAIIQTGSFDKEIILIEHKHTLDDYIKKTQSMVTIRKSECLTNSINEATGEYIAVLYGSDAYISPLKLERQKNFLKYNNNCHFCFTEYYIINPTTFILNKKLPVKFDNLNANENQLLLSTCLFRSMMLKIMDDKDINTLETKVLPALLESGISPAGYLDIFDTIRWA